MQQQANLSSTLDHNFGSLALLIDMHRIALSCTSDKILLTHNPSSLSSGWSDPGKDNKQQQLLNKKL